MAAGVPPALWASIAAIYNQYATTTGKIPLNSDVNSQLYLLASRRHRYSGAITDVIYKAEYGADLFSNSGAGWDGATGDGCAVTAAADGSFSCAGKIPPTASYVTQRIVATGMTSAAQAASIFDVVGSTHYAYVTNFNDGTVSPINTATP